jgi:hypothetical protein
MIRFKFAAAGLLLAALLAPNLDALDANAATGPFLAMAGTWSGGGTITMANGVRERVRCRAAYGVAERGDNFEIEPALRQRQLQFRPSQRRRLSGWRHLGIVERGRA